MGWLQTRGRSILAFLSDLGGALAFVAVAAGLIVAAITGAVLVAWTAFPQPYFTLLVVGMAFLAVGLVLHFLRAPLTAPEQPQRQPPGPRVADQEASARAAALVRKHEEKAKEEKSKEEEAQKEIANLRRANRRIREELLDNRYVVNRIPRNVEGLLALRFDSWTKEKAALLDQDDPKPHEMASAAYRELQGLLRGRVGENNMDGSPYIHGDPPRQHELDSVELAIDRAVETLV